MNLEPCPNSPHGYINSIMKWYYTHSLGLKWAKNVFTKSQTNFQPKKKSQQKKKTMYRYGRFVPVSTQPQVLSVPVAQYILYWYVLTHMYSLYRSAMQSSTMQSINTKVGDASITSPSGI